MLIISTISLANESIGVGKDEKYGYEIKLKVEKESNGNIKNIEVLEDNTKKSISKKAIPKLIEQAKKKIQLTLILLVELHIHLKFL